MPEYKVTLDAADNARLEAIRAREGCGAAEAFRVALREAEAPRRYPEAKHGELRGLLRADNSRPKPNF